MAKNGGARPGAGRPVGSGNIYHNELRAKLELKYKETPLEYMMRRMCDRNLSDAIRDDMAKAAAPYFHQKLAAATLTDGDGQSMKAPTVVVSFE